MDRTRTYRKASLLIFIFVCAVMLHAQTYGTGVDPYFGDWHRSPVHIIYGSLRTQDVFAAQSPAAKTSAVQSFRHAILPAKATTSAIHVKGVQQIYFIEAGSGEARVSNGTTIALSRGGALLAPDGISFTLLNTGKDALSFYMIEETVPAGFHAKNELVLRDTNKIAFQPGLEQWSYLVKPVFSAADGLATLNNVSVIEMSALTIGRPKLTQPGTEVFWTTLRGTPLAFVGNVLRRQPEGMTYMEIADGKTPHSAVDPDQNAPVTFLVFGRGQQQ